MAFEKIGLYTSPEKKHHPADFFFTQQRQKFDNIELKATSGGLQSISPPSERSSLPSKKFLCIPMGMLQIGALSLVGKLVEAPKNGVSSLKAFVLFHHKPPTVVKIYYRWAFRPTLVACRKYYNRQVDTKFYLRWSFRAFPGCQDSYDRSECHRLCDLGRHKEPP